MTPEEEQQLRELQADLAGAANSAHEPRCVALAFASPISGRARFTMQMWIDLEAIRSPLLRGEPLSDAEELKHAGLAFGMLITPETHTPEEADLCLEEMRDAIDAGFSMSLPMRPPEEAGSQDNQGFGAWLPIYACLVKDCGVDPEAALRMDVGRAFALLAGVRHNQGWGVTGTAYALRDVATPETEADHG